MCGVCERIKETKAGENPFLVKELETGYVVIGDFQHFSRVKNEDKKLAEKSGKLLNEQE